MVTFDGRWAGLRTGPNVVVEVRVYALDHPRQIIKRFYSGKLTRSEIGASSRLGKVDKSATSRTQGVIVIG